MAIAKGQTALIEDAMSEVLAALTYDGAAVFKTAQPFAHQFGSFSESFQRFAPFAFVGFAPQGPEREGGYDLSQAYRFEVLFGCTSVADGDARRGADGILGASKIRDLVIAALDRWHPGSDFDCDEFYFVEEMEYLDAPKQYAAGLVFLARRLPAE